MEKIFSVNVSKYEMNKDFEVYYPASLDRVRDYAVTFLTSKNLKRCNVFENCKNNLIFWPQDCSIP